MKKMSIFLTSALLLGMTITTAFAFPMQTKQQETVSVFADESVNDTLINKVKESTSAVYTDSLGASFPMKTQIIIETVEDNAKAFATSADEQSGDFYKITVKATADRTSTETGQSDESSIQASGSLTMYWKDNAYPAKNVLTQISGSWSCGTPGVNISGRHVLYTNTKFDFEGVGNYYPTQNTFNYYPKYEEQDIQCKSWAYFTKNGVTADVTIVVNPFT